MTTVIPYVYAHYSFYHMQIFCLRKCPVSTDFFFPQECFEKFLEQESLSCIVTLYGYILSCYKVLLLKAAIGVLPNEISLYMLQ